ncbi:hypothetical protein [Oceanispirochaeta crateris]|uniref:hypothetical protein n=1 Tax=Oceanispirochaeta crateris TaxID=2518645 RepID=UPI001AEF69EE|nr:hypothetical protein [Oceanispirochaeta crateris]
MDIVKANEQDSHSIIDMISKCITSMEDQGIYQWNEDYPSFELIKKDIKDGCGYVIKDSIDASLTRQ